jgi:excisionase family DNA binding protein
MTSMATDQFEYLSTQQAAVELGMSDGRVRQLLLDGTLAGRKLGEDQWAIHRDEVERFKAIPPPERGRPRGGTASPEKPSVQ